MSSGAYTRLRLDRASSSLDQVRISPAAIASSCLRQACSRRIAATTAASTVSPAVTIPWCTISAALRPPSVWASAAPNTREARATCLRMVWSRSVSTVLLIMVVILRYRIVHADPDGLLPLCGGAGSQPVRGEEQADDNTRHSG